jgi:cell division septation protein DedD
MIKVSDYAKKLLHEHDCVVIPELGGFLTHFDHAFYSKQDGTYHAPQKRVAFNEALKLDDGLLVHYLTVNEQITREDAQNRVKSFVDYIKTEVQENREVTLDGIGMLKANHEGKLLFEPTFDTNFYDEGFGFNDINIDPATEVIKIQEADIEEVWANSSRDMVEFDNEIPLRRKSRTVWYAAAGVALVGAVIWGGMTSISTTKMQSSLNPASVIPTILSKFESKEDTKKTIIKQAEKAAPAPKAAIEATPPAIIAPVVAPTTETPKNIAVKATENESVKRQFLSDEIVKYYIVAGSFANKNNAEGLIQRMQNKGYKNAFILNPEAAEGVLFQVAIIGFESSNKAKSQLAIVNRATKTKGCIVGK